MYQILRGDCLEQLKNLESESIDSVVTDPPYGLGTKEPTVQEIINYLQGAELDQGGDFMSRDWNVPSVEVWKECYRVLKPGGHVLSFGGTRTFDLISLGLRAAGFENRDTIASQLEVAVLQWIQGQGFPKSQSVQKQLIKNGLSAEEAAAFEGWGTALKPSWEPILVFRKPIAESTVAKQMLATRTGAINIDACRVGISSTDPNHRPGVTETTIESESIFGLASQRRGSLGTGRWPSNVILTHASGCKLTGTKKVDAPVINRFTDGAKPFGNGAGHAFESEQRGDADGKEEIAIYDCQDDCPVKALDNQSGILKTGGGSFTRTGIGFQGGSDGNQAYVPPSEGGASRFFPQFENLDAPFIYSAKVSKKERDKDLPKGTNSHPTVKPQTLMSWLVKLVTPIGGTVLDAYSGSGSTGVAAIELGCNYIGIERDPEFQNISELRCQKALERFNSKPVSSFDLMEELSDES